MLMTVSSQFNPFEPPQEVEVAIDPSPVNQWRQVIRQFREESRALAGMSVVLAAMTGLVATVASSESLEMRTIVSVGMGLAAMVAFGVAAVQIAIAKMMGVRLLLFLVYVYLIIALLMIPLTFGFIIPVAIGFGVVAAQCHRVLKNAQRLNSVGIPLNTRPHELMTEHFRQFLEPLQP